MFKKLLADMKAAIDARDWEAVLRLIGAGFGSTADLWKMLMGGAVSAATTAALSVDVDDDLDALELAVNTARGAGTSSVQEVGGKVIDVGQILDLVTQLIGLWRKLRG